MQNINFFEVQIQLGGSPDENGVIVGTGSVNFPTNVIDATATLGQWELNANNICFVTMGAEITNVQFSGTTVEVSGSLNLYNNGDEKISPQGCVLTAKVVAICE